MENDFGQMDSAMFYLEEFNFGGIQDKLCTEHNVGLNSVEEVDIGKQSQFSGADDWENSRGIDSFFSQYGFYEDDSLLEECLLPMYEDQEQQQESSSDYGLLDDLQFDVVTPPLQICLEEIAKLGEIPSMIPIVESKKEKVYPFSFAGLELLKNHSKGFKKLNTKRIIEAGTYAACTEVSEDRRLSTEEIIRIAGTRFIQSSSQEADVPSMISHPFEWSFFGLSQEEIKDVELLEFLLAAAEKVGYQQFERASKLLNHCNSLSSSTGNPVQRIVYYFAAALQEKIERETGRISSKVLEEKPSLNIDEMTMSPSTTKLAFHLELPFSQLVQFAGIQAIIENVAEARKVHVIDFSIRNGLHWTVLMQALASRSDCPLELLKITSVGTTSKHLMEDTGKSLLGFAQTMNISFSFKIVMVSDMADLREDLFDLDSDEVVAVHSKFCLWTMIIQPNKLETMMRVIRNLNPCVMVVAEAEANHNSPVFVNRFIEALFYYGVYVDCFEAFMKQDDENRMVLESLFFDQGVRNIVATEGEERKIRHVKIDVWKAFFARFGLEEVELSQSSLYQANLVVKNFSCASYCTLDMNGKCMLIGWKGTPLISLSVWKFLSQ
ncbi:hypothetical protein FNV43_RR00994 [Rhamnella rubrinervis]|uniref:DELLA protein RGL1-like n=1 Tax=Rhamnella rubrinervis TaxID=2594499 RepID=A0A8K0HRR8_9ROSA|nr:hypothetical protein FNV43_RR00994 [Rhamnella rubrinervis]